MSPSVKAIRKILTSPPVAAAFVSTALAHESGNLISNQPKNDRAKITSKRKRNTLNNSSGSTFKLFRLGS